MGSRADRMRGLVVELCWEVLGVGLLGEVVGCGHEISREVRDESWCGVKRRAWQDVVGTVVLG